MYSTGFSKFTTITTLAMASLFLVSGCTTVGPDFVKPDVPVADTWLEADTDTVDTSSSVYQDWWEVFSDPVLTNLIDAAYSQNLGLQVAGLRVMEARAQLGIAGGLKYPQAQSVGAGYAYSRSSINSPPLSNLPGDVLAGVDRTNGVWSASFDATWEADIWGKFSRGVEAADANLAANMLNYDAVLVTLTGDVAALYTSIRTLEERIDFTRANVKIQQRALHLADTRFKLGATSELDVQQARGLLYNTQALIPIFTLNLERTRNTLSFLLGMPPSNLESLLGESGKIPVAPETVAVGIPAELLRRRPDVRAAEMAAAAQSAAIGINKADLYPSFVLAGSIGLAGTGFSDMFDSGGTTGFITPFFKWNIFNYGRIKNNVRVQDARFEQAVTSYQNTALAAAKEVQDGLQGFLRTQEQVKFLQEAVTASSRAVNLALEQYNQGASDYTRVLNTQTALLAQQDSLTSARGQVVSSLVATYKALGGGWQLREGNNYVGPELINSMEERTDWGELLTP
ncbi:MAG: efflux transporter outer membrane subunit, partial [Proteobacteria bacterium]|nr:efflux transporter outer membrane subunit [Pseudomonadota bacterium]